MFLGYFLTFGLMAVTDVLGARIFRGKLEIRRTGDQISQEYVLDELEMLVQELGQIISAPPEDAEWYEKMGRSMAALSGFTFSLRRFLKSGVWQIAGYRAYQTYTSQIVRTEGSAVEYNLTLEAADFIFFLSFRALLWVGGRVPDVGWTDVWNGLKFTYYSCRAIREG